MTLNFEDESGIELGLDPEEVAKLVIRSSLEALGCPYEAEVNILITDEEEVHRLNLEFRGIDRTTDVLSFPMTDFEQEGDFSFLEDARISADCFNPLTGELLLGDIVLNAARIISQAEEYGHSVLREYAFLITHSVLHLTGFDHMEEEEEKRMQARQRDILAKINIGRS